MAAMVVTAVAVMAEDMEGDTVATMIGNVNLLLSVVFAFALGYECVSVCAHRCISDITYPIFAIFSIHVAFGRGLISLWRHCDMLSSCTFMDDTMFLQFPF